MWSGGCLVTKSFLTLWDPWTVARQASLSFTIYKSLLTLMSVESVMPSNHLILCCPLLLPPIFPSIRVFSNELALPTRWPDYWNFSFSVSPTNEYSGLISFRTVSFNLLALHKTLKNLLQHHSSKASVLQHSPFFMVQLLQPYRTTGITIALTAAAARSLQSCSTPSDPMDCSPPGSSVHGIFQAGVLEWGAIAFSIALTKRTFFRAVIKSVITEEMSKDDTDKAIARALPVEKNLKLNFFWF